MNNRLIKMDGIYNMRDLGGLENKDKKIIKPGLIFRSARLEDATKSDITKLDNENIKLIFDYRSYDEALKHPDPAMEGVNTYVIPALKNDPTKADTADLNSFLQKASLDEFVENNIEMYKNLPFNNLSYKLLFNHINSDAPAPFIHHCTAGRDRTGVASALILKLLDVNEDVIMEDYLLSNEGLVNFYDQMLDDYIKDPGIKKKIISVIDLKPEYLQASLDAIKEKYSTYDEFLLKEYNISAKDKLKIKDYYLK